METKQISIERGRYHEFLEKLKTYLLPGAVIYDIGKSDIHDYKLLFAEYQYITIDCNPAKGPDIVVDIETVAEDRTEVGNILTHRADAVLCNGVVEQCGNLNALLAGLARILKPGGLALFGFISIGYPIYSNDRLRLTPGGAGHYCQKYGFKAMEINIVMRGDIPSYVFMFCRKGV